VFELKALDLLNTYAMIGRYLSLDLLEVLYIYPSPEPPFVNGII